MVLGKVPVSMRSLLGRINRKLVKEEEVLKTLRGNRHLHDLGRHYIVSTRSGSVRAAHVSPAMLAQELGVLQTWEALEEEA